MTAEESTDGEVEAQTYNQDSQDSIGEVSVFEEQESSAEIAICPPNSQFIYKGNLKCNPAGFPWKSLKVF